MKYTPVIIFGIAVLFTAVTVTFAVLTALFPKEAEHSPIVSPIVNETDDEEIQPTPDVATSSQPSSTDDWIAISSEHEVAGDEFILTGSTSVKSATVTVTIGGDNTEVQSDQLGRWSVQFNRHVLPTVGNRDGEITLSVRVLPHDRKYQYEYLEASKRFQFELPVVEADTVALWASWLPEPIAFSEIELGSDFVRAFFVNEKPYKTGTVTQGEFKNWSVFIRNRPCEMHCRFAGYQEFLVSPEFEKMVILQKDWWWGYGDWIERGVLTYSDSYLRRPELYFPDLNFSKELSLQNSGYDLTRGQQWAIQDFSSTTRFSFIDSTVSGEAVYIDKKDYYLNVKHVDGTTIRYQYDIPFILEDKQPQITWFDGTKNTADYQIRDMNGGCGSASNVLAIRPNLSSDDLRTNSYEWAGVANSGERMYTITDPLDERLVELHDRFGWRGYGEGREVVPYDEFIDSRPLVYFVTPHDMVVELRRADYRPLAECGKPVVYLYPEEEMDVSVFVDLKGPMTISEPEHGPLGWSVIAHTDGYVTDTTDGTRWPNLYWEGYGVNYKIPEEGFVVAQEDIATWLPETLDEIGFTEREKNEFLEFWLPELPKSPYVLFTFIDQEYFDRDAALIIEPAPDTVTRVFMEYRPLAEYREVGPQTLPYITRDGFTVVEWGGALYHEQ